MELWVFTASYTATFYGGQMPHIKSTPRLVGRVGSLRLQKELDSHSLCFNSHKSRKSLF